MIDKFVQTMADAMADVQDGSTVLLAGFGAVGQPLHLIDGWIEQSAKDLTIVANNPGVGRIGLARLRDLGRVRKVICSFPRSSESNWKSYRRAPWPNACTPQAPVFLPFLPPLPSEHGWRKARNTEKSTAEHMSWETHFPVIWRWLNAGRLIVGETSPIASQAATSIR